MREAFRHLYRGYIEYEIAVFPVKGRRWHKWEARWREKDFTERTVPRTRPPNLFWGGDFFAARTERGAYNKALRQIKREDARREREDALWATLLT